MGKPIGSAHDFEGRWFCFTLKAVLHLMNPEDVGPQTVILVYLVPWHVSHCNYVLSLSLLLFLRTFMAISDYILGEDFTSSRCHFLDSL